MTPNDQREQRRYELARESRERLSRDSKFKDWDFTKLWTLALKDADALLAELEKTAKPEQQTPAPAQPTVSGHSGDCTIYSSLVNSNPECGICTCGYGWSLVRKGDRSQMYSAERKTPQPSPATGKGLSDEEILNKIHGHIDPNFTLGSLNFIRSLLAPVAPRPMPSVDVVLNYISEHRHFSLRSSREMAEEIIRMFANTAAPKPILITKDQIEKWCREVPPHTKRKEAMAFAILNLKNLGLPVDLLMPISEAGLAHHKDCTQGVSSDICNCNQLEDAELANTANTAAPQAKRMTDLELAPILYEARSDNRTWSQLAAECKPGWIRVAQAALDAIAPGCQEWTDDEAYEIAKNCAEYLGFAWENQTKVNWARMVQSIARANPAEGK